VAALDKAWRADAAKYDVLPVNDSPLLDRTPWIGPSDQARRTRFEFTPADRTIGRAEQPVLRGRAYRITADVARTDSAQQGVLVAAGDAYAGWSLFVKDNRLVYENNIPEFGGRLVSDRPLPTGRATLGFRFEPSIPGGGAGVGTLLVNGEPAGSMTFRRPPNLVWEGMDIGRDTLTPVSGEYAAPNPFTGTLDRVVFDLASLPPA